MPPELGFDADPLVIQLCVPHTRCPGWTDPSSYSLFWFHSLKVLRGKGLYSVSTPQVVGQSSFCSRLGVISSGPAVLQPSNALESPRGPGGTVGATPSVSPGAGVDPSNMCPGETAAAGPGTTSCAGVHCAVTAGASPNMPKVAGASAALELKVETIDSVTRKLQSLLGTWVCGSF